MMKRTLLFPLVLAAPAMGCGGASVQAPAGAPPEGPPPAAATTATVEPDTGAAGPVWVSADKLTEVCAGGLERGRALADEVRQVKADGGTNTVDNTFAPFHQMMRVTDTAAGWASLMFNVHPDEAVRGAAKQCQQDLSEFSTKVFLDRALYEALSAVQPPPGDAELARSLSHILRDFRRSGVDKDEATRTRLEAINKELVEASQAFRQLLNEDVRSVEVDGPAGLAGLPQDFIDAQKPNENGKLALTTDYTDFYPVQTYAKDTTLRKNLYDAFMGRGFPANGERLKQVLALRHEYATLLGHPNWASYNAEDKMARDQKTIDAFIQDVAKIARPRMQADLAELLAAKKKDDPKAKRIEAWDRFYYMAKVREDKHAFDAKEVRPYFGYSAVKDGIFALYGELFGLSFERLPDEPVWHPKVEAWAMKADGKLVGKFYLDMHPRKDKYKHAAMFSIQTGTQGGDIPMGTLVCNFPDPGEGDGKAMMEHSQVTTFFHEFGHLIHHLLASRARYVNLAGINVEWDFVEAPSQLLEEWAWDAKVLQRFAKHVDTGEPIPADLVRRMRQAEEFGKGADVMRQVFYAAYSFYLHTADPEQVDLEKFTNTIYGDYSPYPRTPEDKIYANFGHLMGYSSMYYTYQWSLSLAKDIFTRFEAEGIENAEVARAYRDLILAPGGSRDARDLVRDFLGREPSLDAYQKWLQGN